MVTVYSAMSCPSEGMVLVRAVDGSSPHLWRLYTTEPIKIPSNSPETQEIRKGVILYFSLQLGKIHHSRESA